MKIKADVKLIHSDKVPKLKAFAALTLDGLFCVKGLRVLEGEKGLFVSMPQERKRRLNKATEQYEDTFVDSFFPITKEARDEVSSIVLRAYERELQRQQEAETASQEPEM